MTGKPAGRPRAVAPAGVLATYVSGHKNPDTDSIASAIACAELLRAEGQKIVAAQAGRNAIMRPDGDGYQHADECAAC